MDKLRRRRVFLVFSIISLLILFNLHGFHTVHRTFSHNSYPSLPLSSIVVSTNKTLGFGVVAAVSRPKSPRREGLLWAANLTGVEITIPEQPEWPDEHVAKFRTKVGSQIDKGSALAWLGHLNALKWFLSTPHETALILEDDVDWNILLRRTQIPLASAALRSILPPRKPSRISPLTYLYHSTLRRNNPAYWGPAPDWEILWLGHCGDQASPEHITSHPHIAYHDATVLPHNVLDPSAADPLRSLNVSEEARIVHRSYWPLCTFAYAVTRASAQRILDEYGNEGEGGCSAYDVRLLEACRDHGWQCYTIVPELFHHIEAPSEIANVNTGVEGKVIKPDRARFKGTKNIGCGARHPNMWIDKSDERGRKWMMERVQNGECLVG